MGERSHNPRLASVMASAHNNVPYGTAGASTPLKPLGSRNPYRHETIASTTTDSSFRRPSHAYILPTLQEQPTGASSRSTRSTFTRATTKAEDGGPAEQLPEPARQADHGWATCLKVMTDYDKNLVRGWNEKIDGLLLLSALLSAVVTTFVVDYYSELQPDPVDANTALLAQILVQLSTLSPQSTPSIAGLADLASDTTFIPSRSAVYINALWFLSLTLSLLTAVAGLLIRQWLTANPLHSGTGVRARVRARQRRHTALVKWRVAHVVALLPILLQVSVALFLAGLVQLLWTLNTIVAILVTIPVVLATTALSSTLILPAFSDDCPYRSPLSDEVTKIVKWTNATLKRWPRRANINLPVTSSKKHKFDFTDKDQVTSANVDKEALAWTQDIVTDFDLVKNIIPCLADLDREAVVTWVAQERNVSVPKLLDRIREDKWRLETTGGDPAGRELLLTVLLEAIKDRADDTSRFGVSQMDMIGLFAHLVDEVSVPSLAIRQRCLEDLLSPLQEVVMRSHHSKSLARLIYLSVESAESRLDGGLPSYTDSLLQWALRMFKYLSPHARSPYGGWTQHDQQAFEYAASAALSVVRHASQGTAYQQVQFRKVLAATAYFFEHTTLGAPSVPWFPILRRLLDADVDSAGDSYSNPAMSKETAGEVRKALESLVALYRGSWADRWLGSDGDGQMQYDMLERMATVISPLATGGRGSMEISMRGRGGDRENGIDEWEPDDALAFEVRSIWTSRD